MTESPLITVVTVTYNAARVLAPTMQSVAAQTFRDFEHLVVDGASSDGTLALARCNPDTRIVSERDRGLYDAMNKGLVLARGRYVLFLNAGDAFHAPDTLSLYARAAASGADIIYSDTVIVDAARRVLGPRHLSVPGRLTFRSFADGMLVCHQAFMVRRTIAPEFDLRYRFSADYDWTVRCLAAGDESRYVNLRTVGIDYLSDGMTDRNKLASLRERWHIMSRHYGAWPTLARHIKFAWRALRRGSL